MDSNSMDIYETARAAAQRSYKLLTIPANTAGDVRAIFTKHLTFLIEQHNLSTQAAINFVKLGQDSPLISERKPFIAHLLQEDARKREAVAQTLEGQKLLMPNLESLSDAEFVQSSIEVMLALRSLLLPDSEMA